MIRFVFQIFLFLFLGSLNFYCQINCNTFSSYFGGAQFDEIKSTCIDANKNNYIIGNTFGTDLPITPGLINDFHLGNYDVFITKIDSCGGLVWCTYFGSPNFDSAEKMAVTNDGNIVFCGYTNGVNTPTSLGCFQGINNGSYDCYITKITPNGTIIWSTYFGKSGGDFAYDIKVDALDNVIIGGTTTSVNLYTTPNSFQSNHKGNTDAFIARFSKDGLLKWCTYYGGSGSEDIHALEIDADCNIIGSGGSSSINLNTSINAYQAVNDGSFDSYLIKLDSNCVRVFSTFIGGSGIDDAWGIACDTFGNIYLGGHTNSADFDTTNNSYQTTNNGSNDWYITKWSATGALIKSTLFGGNLNDYLSRMTIYSSTELILIGKTESSDIPIIGINNQPTIGGSYDVLIGKFNLNSLAPTWISYFGGTAEEDPFDIVELNSSLIIFTGSTNSLNYPLSLFPFQSSLNASNDGFITKLMIDTQSATALNTIDSNPLFSVFPNPTKNTITVLSENVLKLECVDVLGNNISDFIVPLTKNSYDVGGLIPGVYFLTIKSEKGNRIVKLIIDL